ncbi:hypothetical protein EXIGLDRAFT_839598 [Exidia glandulosa HHB12029]|uniref:REJ domain-containing protein n=1 Tax=Exidia glandulosa HHB12029 TaxID=1314781 RepID=A0A165EXY2_EXIGL|nr:hypothetical protein EXIGLDRAFT_839598 [Exidia glandulosa HHB12029]
MRSFSFLLFAASRLPLAATATAVAATARATTRCTPLARTSAARTSGPTRTAKPGATRSFRSRVTSTRPSRAGTVSPRLSTSATDTRTVARSTGITTATRLTLTLTSARAARADPSVQFAFS